MYCVYVLYDVVDPDHFRYVGKAKQPDQRFKDHLAEARRGSSRGAYKGAWLRSVDASGSFASYAVIAAYETEDEAYAAEILWIADLRRAGHQLTNVTEGGEGWRFNPWSLPHVRARLEAAARLRSADPEFIARVSAASAEYWSSSANRAKQSARVSKHFEKAENREATRIATKAAMSNELLAACAQASRDAWSNPDNRQKWIAAAHTPELDASRAEKARERMKDPANRTAIAEAVKQEWRDPERRAARIAAIKASEGAAHSAETNRRLWADPKHKADRSARISLGHRLRKARNRGWVLPIVPLNP